MSAVALLVGLLALAYIGSILVGGRAIRGYGLPSGAEYVLLGFVLGPDVLGVIERSTTRVFEPIAVVGLAWLALVVGVDYGYVGARRVRARGIALGVVLALIAGAAGAAVVYATALRLTALRGTELWLVALGSGAVTCETTRHGVRWVVQRHGAEGPLANALADLSDSDDAVPLLALAGAFVLGGTPIAALGLGAWPAVVAPIAIGAALGAVAALLIGRELSTGDAWGVLLGTGLLTIGTTARFGMSALSAAFVMGVTLSALSPHGATLRKMFEQTERPVLLPMLLLAGANVDPHVSRALLAVAAVAIATRLVVKLGSGLLLRSAAPSARQAGPLLGLGMLPSGAVTLCVGLAFALRFPGAVGNLVLLVATATTILGELIGPAWLRRELARAGEIGVPRRTTPRRGKRETPREPGRASAQARRAGRGGRRAGGGDLSRHRLPRLDRHDRRGGFPAPGRHAARGAARAVRSAAPDRLSRRGRDRRTAPR